MTRLFRLKCSIFIGDRERLRRLIAVILTILLMCSNIFFLDLSLDTGLTSKYFIYNSIVGSIITAITIYILRRPTDLYNNAGMTIDSSIHMISLIFIYFIVTLIYSKDIVIGGVIKPNDEVIDPLGTASSIMISIVGVMGNFLFTYFPGYIISNIMNHITKSE